MGSVLSYSTEDENGDEAGDFSYTELFQSSFIPLNQKVKVHLVPKFYASDDGGGYFLLVTLRETTNLCSNSKVSYYTANVGFHRGDALVSARELFGRPRGSRTVSMVEDSDIAVQEVIVKKGEFIRICGVFNNGSRARSAVDLEQNHSFDLILCPSAKIKPQPEEWFLLGTLYTKPVNVKRERQWKAAVRKDFN